MSARSREMYIRHDFCFDRLFETISCFFELLEIVRSERFRLEKE